MYFIIAPIKIKPGFKDRFVEEMLGDFYNSFYGPAAEPARKFVEAMDGACQVSCRVG